MGLPCGRYSVMVSNFHPLMSNCPIVFPGSAQRKLFYIFVVVVVVLAGHKPYCEQNIGLTFDSFIRYLVEGNRLPQPVGCPNIL